MLFLEADLHADPDGPAHGTGGPGALGKLHLEATCSLHQR